MQHNSTSQMSYHQYNWHSKLLNLSSEADPSVLAKYVIALLKKDESFNEETFVEQLEVFLDKGMYGW